MLVADIKELPKIGEYVIMENSVHGDTENLKAVGYLTDDEDPDGDIHVLFASDDEADNIYEEQGVKYYCIRAYIKMEDE